MGRADLIGSGKNHLVPAWQPAGTGKPVGNRPGKGAGKRAGGGRAPRRAT